MSTRYGALNSYLDTFVSKMLVNDNLCKLLYYTTNTDILSMPNLTQEQKLGLIGSNIFINKRVPVIQDVARPMIMLRITNIGYSNKKNSHIENIQITMYIICANSIIETENGTRDLCLVTALEETFDTLSAGEVGIGKIFRTRTMDLVDLGTEYQGYVIAFEISDFALTVGR